MNLNFKSLRASLGNLRFPKKSRCPSGNVLGDRGKMVCGYSWSTSRVNGNSKIQNNVTSHVLNIWAFALDIQRGISKIERRFRICRRYFEIFRPGYVNALGRKNRPCRPLSLFDWRGTESDLHSSSCNSWRCLLYHSTSWNVHYMWGVQSGGTKLSF